MRLVIKRFGLIVAGGIFCGTAATAISAAMVTLCYAAPTGAFPTFGAMVQGFLVMCLFTAVPAGLFGFLAGVAGSAWLRSRSKHFHSRVQIIRESAVAGFVLSLIFPVFHWALGWGGDHPGHRIDLRELEFSVGVGLSCAVLFAVVFGDFLLARELGDRRDVPQVLIRKSQ